MNDFKSSFDVKILLIVFLCGSVSMVSCMNDASVRATESAIEYSEDDIVIRNKAFNLFEMFSESENINTIIKDDDVLNSIDEQHWDRIQNASEECRDVPCYASAFQWDDEEIARIGDRLVSLYQSTSTFNETAALLRERDSYILFEDGDDESLIRNAWENAAYGTNHVVDVFLKGVAPRYPLIDSISYQVDDQVFFNKVKQELDALVAVREDHNLPFYELPLNSALAALRINDRNEAARYEPLRSGYNEAPFNRIYDVSWDDYEYSVILVPGQGPQDFETTVDPRAKRRIDDALQRFDNGLAPFIVVSGGHVHPFQTPVCEAVEMKKYMVGELGIPDDVIFIEPHARHTTTNLRNTSRMIFRFGMPADKPVLIVTDSRQNGYINGRMGGRGVEELGYLPFRDLKKLSDQESEFYPIETVLQVDPFDVLDP